MRVHVASKHSRFMIALLSALASSLAAGVERIVIDGSTGMLPLAQALASAYEQRSSDPHVEIGKGLGTEARIRALVDGKIQIALVSHGLKPDDVQKENLKIIELAKGAIVFAVNATVPITNISDSQVCDAYSGKIKNWKALGGPDNDVALFTRPPTEVDPEVIRAKLDCFKSLREIETAKVMARGGDMARALAASPYALGMTSMTVVEQSAGKVRALSLNGIEATAENVKNGRYVLTREFLFVTTAEPTGPVKRFLDFALSPEGDGVIRANGAVPLR